MSLPSASAAAALDDLLLVHVIDVRSSDLFVTRRAECLTLAALELEDEGVDRLVELAIDMKARVVGEDLREAGLREVLNYGHTLGHAIEHAERYRWRHGAAISVGMVFAAELSRLAGRLSDDVAQRHRTVLESLGLPTTYRAGAFQTLKATMQRDKKSRGSMLRFIVLDDLARPTVLQAPDESLLFAAYQEVGA